MVTPARFQIRPYRRGDERGVIEAVKAVYDEYGFEWDPAGYHADLYDVPGHYAQGAFLVAESDGGIVGTAALHLFDRLPDDADVVEVGGFRRVGGADCAIERLYVPKAHRRRGIGKALTLGIIRLAREADRRRMEIWSDKRFVEAHLLYRGLGARLVGERLCHDPEQSPEWGFALDL